MKKLYKIVVLLLMPFLVVAHNGKKKGKYTEEKSYQKEFSVNSDALLDISNKFGDVNITSWAQNKVKIDVKITVNGDDKEKVLTKLSNITVDFSNTKSLVKAITVFEKENNKWKKGNKLNFDITYIIKVPVSNSIVIENKYGNINLDRIDGKALINCKYGAVDLGKLNYHENELELRYANNSTIQYINKGVVSAKYSTLSIDKAVNLLIESGYTTTKIGTAESINFEGNYGGLYVKQVEKIILDGNYLKIKVGDLLNKLNIDTSYSTITIAELKKHFDQINIECRYSNIKVNYERDIPFNFIVKTKYGSFKRGDNLKVSNMDNKYYSGFNVIETPSKKISIIGDYSSVKFITIE